MTISKVIGLVDQIKPNDFSDEVKIIWLSECEGMVQTEVWQIAKEDVVTYDGQTAADTVLLADPPHDKIYQAYLMAMIDFANGEYKKYQNTMQIFNTWLREYMRWYAQRYRPASENTEPWRGYYFTAYGIAVKHGFTGTEEEWLAWLYEPKEAADAAYERATAVLAEAEAAAAASAGSAAEAGQAAEGAESAMSQAQAAKESASGYADAAAAAAGEAQAAAEEALAAAGNAAASEQSVAGLAESIQAGDYENRVSTLEKDLADLISDLNYVQIDITSVGVAPTVAELGSVVNEVEVTWKINKTPVSQSLNGIEYSAEVRQAVYTEAAITANTSYTVKATDERDASDSATAWLRFYNSLYIGTMDSGKVINSAALLALGSLVSEVKSRSFTVDCGAGQRIVYALPSRLGTPAFNVGGFDGGFYLAATFDHTNASGYTEEYCVWLSDNTGLGSTTVKVT